MTKEEVLNILEGINADVEEVYECLRVYREARFKQMEKELTENKATLKLIGKVTTDKTVKDILR